MAAYLADTNILLYLVSPAAPEHAGSVRSLEHILANGDRVGLAAQTIYEFWSVAARPAELNGLGWFPERAAAVIAVIRSRFSVLPEPPEVLDLWLTISPGLRYEFYRPPAEANGRASGFVFGNRSSQYPNSPLHMAFQGDAGVPKGFFEQDRNNFAPRLGMAYDITGDGKTALRAGFGAYHAYNIMNIPMWNSERTPWNSAASGGETRNMVDPWGTSRVVVYQRPPTPFSSDISNFAYPPRIDSMIWYDRNWRTPYTLQWNVTLEREMLRGVTVQVGYVATRGLKFFQILDGNLPQWAPNASLTNFNNRRPIAGYGLIESLNSRGRSWHDSFQLTSDVRRVAGMLLRFTYVYGKSLAVVEEDRGQGGDRPANPINVDGEKAEIGARHAARAFGVYDLPRLNGARPFTRAVLAQLSRFRANKGRCFFCFQHTFSLGRHYGAIFPEV